MKILERVSRMTKQDLECNMIDDYYTDAEYTDMFICTLDDNDINDLDLWLAYKLWREEQ